MSSGSLTARSSKSDVASEKSSNSTKNTKTTVKKKKKSRKKKKPIFYINLTSCKYDVVRKCIKEKNWVECDDDDCVDWNIYWTDTSVAPQRVMQLKKYQKINHFPGMLSIARKAQLAINLQRLRAVFPNDFNFFPDTWILPQDTKEFRKLFGEKTGKSKKTFIIKPDHACQGKGIFLTKSWDQVSKIDPTIKYVAQKYVTNPFLIDGYKFDLRIYVLVLSCDPLRIFLYNDGLVRLCTRKYVAPTSKNFSKTRMHLTNYAINKGSEKFEFNKGVNSSGKGSKRSIKWFREYLLNNGYDDCEMWDQVGDIVNKTIISAQPQLAHMYHSCFMDPDNDGFSCFEILGLDVMFTRSLRPILLEVNHSPSFTCDTPLDLEIKHGVIKETMKLINASRYDRSRYKKRVAAQAQSRLYGGGNKAQLRKIDKQIKNKMSLRQEHENKYLKNFERIFPPVVPAQPEPGSQRVIDILNRKRRFEQVNNQLGKTGEDDEKKEEDHDNQQLGGGKEEDVGIKSSTTSDINNEINDLSFVARLHEMQISRHFEKVSNYRKYFVAANDLFEQAAVGPSGLRKSIANNSAGTWKDMKNASAAWTAQIAARAGNVNREILGEELPVNGDEVTSLGIRRQLRHARYLERKDARQTMSVVSMHTNSPVPIQGLGHTRGVSNTPHLFPRPPTADSKSNFYSTKVANAKKNAACYDKSKVPIPQISGTPNITNASKKMTVEDYFREARKYRAQLHNNVDMMTTVTDMKKINGTSLPPSPTKNSHVRNAGSNVKMIRPNTATTVEIVKMEMMKEDEMISGKSLSLQEHGADPSTLFGSFVNYRYKEREIEEKQKKAIEEKVLEKKRARKKKLKSRNSKSASKLGGRRATVKKTTIKLNTKGVRKKIF